jgi:hypothetical protein
MLLPTSHIYPVFLGTMYRNESISMSGNPSHPSLVGAMEGPAQLQAHYPVPLIGLLLAKAQQGKAVAQGFVGDSVLYAVKLNPAFVLGVNLAGPFATVSIAGAGIFDKLRHLINLETPFVLGGL